MSNAKGPGPELKYHGRVFDVYEHDIKLPNGRTTRQSLIDHRATIAAVPIASDGKIILLRQYRPAVGGYLIEIPAGNIDEGESPLECAKRELAEETGHSSDNIVKIYEGYLVPGYCNEYMYFYLAFDLYPAALPGDDDEVIERFSVTLEEALAMMEAGEIVDSKTALALCLTERYLRAKNPA